MGKFKEIIAEKNFTRGTVFIIFNAFLLYVLYFIIKNFDFLAAGVYHIFRSLLSAFSPLFIGLIIAYLLNPLVNLIDSRLSGRLFFQLPDDPILAEKRRNSSRFVSVLLTFGIVFAAVSAVVYGFAAMIFGRLIFTDFFAAVRELIAGFMNYEAELRAWSRENLPSGFASEHLLRFADAVMDRLFSSFSASAAIKAVSGTVGGAINGAVGIIISIYLLKDKDFFLGLWRKFLHLTLPQKPNAIVTETLHRVNGVLSQFVRGALLDALIVSVMSSVALSVIRLDFAVFIGIFAGLCNVIPYFGPLLGMIPAFTVGFFTGSFWLGLLAAAILIIVQQIDSNIIYPKIVGSTTGLHPLTVLLAVSVFGYFFGISGMLLAVPLAGIIQIFVVQWSCSRESRKK